MVDCLMFHPVQGKPHSGKFSLPKDLFKGKCALKIKFQLIGVIYIFLKGALSYKSRFSEAGSVKPSSFYFFFISVIRTV